MLPNGMQGPCTPVTMYYSAVGTQACIMLYSPYTKPISNDVMRLRFKRTRWVTIASIRSIMDNALSSVCRCWLCRLSTIALQYGLWLGPWPLACMVIRINSLLYPHICHLNRSIAIQGKSSFESDSATFPFTIINNHGTQGVG